MIKQLPNFCLFSFSFRFTDWKRLGSKNWALPEAWFSTAEPNRSMTLCKWLESKRCSPVVKKWFNQILNLKRCEIFLFFLLLIQTTLSLTKQIAKRSFPQNAYTCFQENRIPCNMLEHDIYEQQSRILRFPPFSVCLMEFPSKQKIKHLVLYHNKMKHIWLEREKNYIES